jgi:hypothetical protein
MGYTHYWSRPLVIDPWDFGVIIHDLQQVFSSLPDRGGEYYNDVPLILRGGSGTGPPVLDQTEISFNGDGDVSLDHETFFFPKDAYLREWQFGRFPPGTTWDFCKTARKPYDLAVCCALLVIKVHLGALFSFSSDADSIDEGTWLTAQELVRATLGHQTTWAFEQTVD